MSTELPVRLVRNFRYGGHLRLGDLRAIVEECDRRRLSDTALVSVDAQSEWIDGVDAEGNHSPKYPKGDGGHYVTKVEIDGMIDPARPFK